MLRAKINCGDPSPAKKRRAQDDVRLFGEAPVQRRTQDDIGLFGEAAVQRQTLKRGDE